MNGPVHFFLHVPKCAGTTVERHFERTLGDGFLIAPRWKNPLREIVGNRYSLTQAELADVRAVSGHSLSVSLKKLFPGREVRESVLLRDPIGYLLSFYNYRIWRHEEHGEVAPPSFEDWYSAQRRNPISRFLLHRYFEIGYPALYLMSSRARLAYLEEAFERFHFVGGYRRCDEALAGISRELGVDDEVESENVGKSKSFRREDLPEALRARILEENEVDALLYHRWADRGFRAGAPADEEGDREGVLEALSDRDQIDYLLSDAATVMRKKLWRPG